MNKNRLSPQRIKEILKTQYIGQDFYFFEETTSTFDEAEKIVPKNGTVVCARVQKSGRGRLGRQWESSEGGIYFSVILMPEGDTSRIQLMTSQCALAIQRAISEYIACRIKWPNDIVSENGKKLCGILTRIQYQEGKMPYINVGIGINANTDLFGKELVYASSIKLETENEVDENALLCRCLLEMEKCCDIKNIEAVMKEYKEKCITLGSRVRLLYANGKKSETGLCTDIAPDGSLVVKTDDGNIKNVNSGEVSVRGIYGENYV